MSYRNERLILRLRPDSSIQGSARLSKVGPIKSTAVLYMTALVAA
jgi:hypothetical protein